MARALAAAASIIYDPAQHVEEAGRPMNLIDDHQLPGLRAKERIGVLETTAVGRSLEVEIQRLGCSIGGDGSSQSCLANLARSEQDHCRGRLKAVEDRFFLEAMQNNAGD